MALLTVTFLFGCFEMWNVDIWWHLRTGQLIAERMSESPWPWHWVPEHDWYTFTNADRPWIDLHWGFQLAAAAVHRFGGVPGLVLWKAALGVLAVGVGLLGRRRGWSVPVIVACWLPALVVLSGRLYVRPEMFTLVYLATFLSVLFHAAQRPRLLWLLPLVQLLWVNSQGLFVFGPVVLGCCWVDRLARAARGRWAFGAEQQSRATRSAVAAPPHRVTAGLHNSGVTGAANFEPLKEVPFKPLLGATLLVMIACFLNPYGWRGALLPVELYKRVGSERDFYARQVEELQGVGDFLQQAIKDYRDRGKVGPLLNPYLLAHLLTLVLGGVSFVFLAVAGWTTTRHPRLDVFRLLLFAAFAYLGWQARRNNNHFALVVGFVTAANFAEGWSWRQSSRSIPRRAVGKARVALVVVLAGLGFLVVSDTFYAWAGSGRRFGLNERRDWYPHGVAAFAGRNGMPPFAFVAPWGHASTYIFHNAPRRRVFMDGRLEVNARATIERFNEIVDNVKTGRRDWESWLREAVPADRSTAERSAAAGSPALPALLIGRHLAHRTDIPLRNDPAWLLIAPLLRNPRWRCVYCDRAGAVFIESRLAERLDLGPAELVPMYQGRSDE